MFVEIEIGLVLNFCRVLLVSLCLFWQSKLFGEDIAVYATLMVDYILPIWSRFLSCYKEEWNDE